MTEESGKRLEDKIKLTIYVLAIPVVVYLAGMCLGVERDLAAFKVSAAERFVTYERNSQEHAEIKALLRELREELKVRK